MHTNQEVETEKYTTRKDIDEMVESREGRVCSATRLKLLRQQEESKRLGRM